MKCTRTLLIILFMQTGIFAQSNSSIKHDFFSDIFNISANVAVSPARIGTSSIIPLSLSAIAVPLFINNDVGLYGNIQNNKSVFLDNTMPAITLLGDGFIQIGLSGLIYFAGNDRDKDISIIALEGFIVSGIYTQVAKFAIAASRPDYDNARHVFFKYPEFNGSFPSGHTTTAFCEAVIFGKYYGIEYITYPIACLVAFSRVYLGSHWPSDVLGGALLGILCGTEVVNIHDNKKEQNPISFMPVVSEHGKYLFVTYKF